MASTWRRREDTAQIIWDDLKHHGPSTSWAIRQRTGLTHMQFWYGMGYLRDELQDNLGEPLVYSPKRGVYDITSNQADVVEWVRDWRFRSLHTQLYRVEQTLEAANTKFGPSRERTLLLTTTRAVRSMVEALL